MLTDANEPKRPAEELLHSLETNRRFISGSSCGWGHLVLLHSSVTVMENLVGGARKGWRVRWGVTDSRVTMEGQTDFQQTDKLKRSLVLNVFLLFSAQLASPSQQNCFI